VLAACGVCMIGQTASIVPADKKIYALRDVTGTVESPALICASIMSKKLAEGIDALVLDVKVGSGAFMKEETAATHLAQLMVETGEQMGKKVVALLTDMNQPLGRAVGNALEVVECLEVLKGGGPDDLKNLSLELSAWMFYLGERTQTVEQGKKLAATLITNGAAMKKFAEMVRLQGGDDGVVESPGLLSVAPHRLEVASPATGYVSQIDCEKIGIASLVLGGGRSTKEDGIDPAVGVIVHKKIGDKVAAGDSLCTLHYNRSDHLEESRQLIVESYAVGAVAPSRAAPLIHRVIKAASV
jgi:pyrimidine-nucleoside phosphorylase